MRMRAGMRIGQSGNELVLAVFFSFFLHAALVAMALFLYMALTPKVKIPPFYQVKLVSLPAQPQTAPAEETAQPAQKAEQKVQQPKKTALKPVKTAPPKTAMPEFAPQKPKHEKSEKAPEEEETVPSAPPAPAKPGGKSEGVAVSAGSEDFKFPPYLLRVRDKIESNWNPPPVAKGARAKVAFTILRSGRVGEVKLQDSSGNFYFDQAAIRAILSSSPFPQMPDDFYRDSAAFTVDLQEQQ